MVRDGIKGFVWAGQMFETLGIKYLGPIDGLTDQLMALLIELRAESRRTKNFAVADQIRKGLTALKITLEDRPDATKWRRET